MHYFHDVTQQINIFNKIVTDERFGRFCIDYVWCFVHFAAFNVLVSASYSGNRSIQVKWMHILVSWLRFRCIHSLLMSSTASDARSALWAYSGCWSWTPSRWRPWLVQQLAHSWARQVHVNSFILIHETEFSRLFISLHSIVSCTGLGYYRRLFVLEIR